MYNTNISDTTYSYFVGRDIKSANRKYEHNFKKNNMKSLLFSYL